MDFSLLQPQSRHRFLRDILALKRRWLYYFIMVVDPILRFAWIFYAIFTHNSQHSTIVSFMVAFMEVLRRGMWALFRVENEHCANVSQYKASRDVPLPYRLEPLIERASVESSSAAAAAAAAGLGVPVSRQGTVVSRLGTAATSTGVGSPFVDEGLSRRRTDTGPPPPTPRRNFSKILAEAHKQDFEKKRRPLGHVEDEGAQGGTPSDDDDDETDEVVSLLVRDEDAVSPGSAQV